MMCTCVYWGNSTLQQVFHFPGGLNRLGGLSWFSRSVPSPGSGPPCSSGSASSVFSRLGLTVARFSRLVGGSTEVHGWTRVGCGPYHCLSCSPLLLLPSSLRCCSSPALVQCRLQFPFYRVRSWCLGLAVAVCGGVSGLGPAVHLLWARLLLPFFFELYLVKLYFTYLSRLNLGGSWRAREVHLLVCCCISPIVLVLDPNRTVS